MRVEVCLEIVEEPRQDVSRTRHVNFMYVSVEFNSFPGHAYHLDVRANLIFLSKKSRSHAAPFSLSNLLRFSGKLEMDSREKFSNFSSEWGILRPPLFMSEESLAFRSTLPKPSVSIVSNIRCLSASEFVPDVDCELGVEGVCVKECEVVEDSAKGVFGVSRNLRSPPSLKSPIENENGVLANGVSCC